MAKVDSRDKLTENLGRESQYIKDKDFRDIGAVAIIILDPSRTRILLMNRRDEFYLAVPSGKGTLDKHSPKEAARLEMQHETGLENVEVEEFLTYTAKSGGPKVGYYTLFLDEKTFEHEFLEAEPPRTPGKAKKRPPAWYPLDLVLSGKLELPYEQTEAITDLYNSLYL